MRKNGVVPTTPPSAPAALVGGPGEGTQVDVPLYPGLTPWANTPTAYTFLVTHLESILRKMDFCNSYACLQHLRWVAGNLNRLGILD